MSTPRKPKKGTAKDPAVIAATTAEIKPGPKKLTPMTAAEINAMSSKELKTRRNEIETRLKELDAELAAFAKERKELWNKLFENYPIPKKPKS